jgi:hypothetical protein
LFLVTFLVAIDGVEGLLFFKVVKPSAFVFSFDVRNIGGFLELELLPLDALEEGVGLNLINAISAQPVVGVTEKPL